MARNRASRTRRSLSAHGLGQINGDNKFIVPPKPGDAKPGGSNADSTVDDSQAGDSKAGNSEVGSSEAVGATTADTPVQGHAQNGAHGISKKKLKRKLKREKKGRKNVKRNVGSLFMDPGVEEVTVLLENGVERTYKRSGDFRDGAAGGQVSASRSTASVCNLWAA